MKLILFGTTLICFALARPDAIYITIHQQTNGPEKSAPVTFRDDYEKHDIGFYKYHRDPKIWGIARQICEAEGAHLAIINTEFESDLLVKIMEKYPASDLNDVLHKDSVSLGFHDLFVEGEYLTIYGHPLASTGFARWASGQPDNDAGNENCGALHRSGGLNDIPCSVPSPFICEKEIKPVDI